MLIWERRVYQENFHVKKRSTPRIWLRQYRKHCRPASNEIIINRHYHKLEKYQT